MDVSAFSDDNFDAAEWINKTFKNSEGAAENKDAFVSSLVSKLQLYVQQVNSALEDTSQQVLQNMPRIVKDAQNLQNEASILRGKMNEFQSEISQVQKDTGACMSNLERLDNLKTKLQTAKQGLQESDGWGRLTSELDDLLERNDQNHACEKLFSLQRSLAAQHGLPGQKERETQVVDFKNRLEALTSPLVVQSFTSGDVEHSKNYVRIFKMMERLPQLKQYYRTVQKNMLQQSWNETVEQVENSGSNRFLREFYDYLIELFQKQQKWCITVFEDSTEPIIMLSEFLISLQRNRETVITGILRRSSDKLEVIKEMSKANIYFGTSLNRILDSEQCGKDVKQTLSQSVFDYFNVFIKQYSNLEQTNLSNKLSELNLNENTAAETIRNLESANTKVIQWINEALIRCSDITQNCGLPSLMIVLQMYIKQYLEKYKKAQQQLEASRTAKEDWGLLQLCINLLQHLGDFNLYLIELERQICNALMKKYEDFSQNEKLFQYKINGKREVNEFKKIISAVQESQMKPIGDKSGILSGVFKILGKICEEIHDTTLASAFSPVEEHFKNIEPATAMNANDEVELPDYSFAPQEYITQVGQYLLTLPQHLEPLLLSPSKPLKIALEICDEKYSRNIPSADILLSLISEECCAMYQEQVGHIKRLTNSEAKQLATDIEYLGNVLEELGLSLGTHLQQSAALLRAPTDKYLQLSAGCDPRLVTAIRQMRNIVSTD